jgi:hypothetical protein
VTRDYGTGTLNDDDEEQLRVAKQKVDDVMRPLSREAQERVVARVTADYETKQRATKKELDVAEEELRNLNVAFSKYIRHWGIKTGRAHPSELESVMMLYASIHADGLFDAAELVLQKLSMEAYADELPWVEQWRTCGYARMNCGHKLAAALMMTTAPDDMEVLAPWKAWSLYVPNGLLVLQYSLDDLKKEQVAARRSGMTKRTYDFLFQVGDTRTPDVQDAEICRIWCVGSEPRSVIIKFADICIVSEVLTHDGSPMNTAIRNYVKGVCLTLDTDVETHRKGVWGPKTGKKRTGKEPIAGCQYELGSPVTIDLRAAVKEFVYGARRGVSSPPKVQFLVRGHWRNQPHGPGRQDRKHIWIEPFWKGDEQARVLLRAHNIKVRDAPDLDAKKEVPADDADASE